MSWAQIKKAINSTLGTKDFKPLNELILGERSLVSSDNVFLVTTNNQPITCNFNGAIQVIFNFGIYNYDSGDKATVKFTMLDSNEAYKINTQETYVNPDRGSTEDFRRSFTVNVKKGEVYTFNLEKVGVGTNEAILRFYDVQLCGTIVMANSIMEGV